jgi:hypothetical protein
MTEGDARDEALEIANRNYQKIAKAIEKVISIFFIYVLFVNDVTQIFFQIYL